MQPDSISGAYMEALKDPEPLKGTATVRQFKLSVTAAGVVGTIQLREGTAGRTFTITADGKQLLVDGAPATSLTLSHNDITGEIEVVR
jgi:hypothetical protein